jgi:hypothetical protein
MGLRHQHSQSTEGLEVKLRNSIVIDTPHHTTQHNKTNHSCAAS